MPLPHPFIDGHLDLALNGLALRRQITGPLEAIRAAEADNLGPFDTATVTLPDLRAGGAVMVVSSLLARCRPWRVKSGQIGVAAGDFPDQDGAYAAAAAQLAYYESLERRGEIRLVRSADELPAADAMLAPDEPLPLLAIFEGADPVRDPDDLHRWHRMGIRSLMLAHFGRSVYAHGTPAEPDDAHPNDVDGPLTDAGRRLLPEIEALRMPLDLTHLSDTALYEALDSFGGVVYASHCACRTLNPDWQRNLPDDVIQAISQRGGVIGLPLHSPFLVKGYQRDTPREACNLDHVVDHLDRLCEVSGSDAHVALGTDMDGGYGLEYTPTGVDRSADMPRLAERMSERGWSEDAIGRVFAGNWHRFWSANLPA